MDQTVCNHALDEVDRRCQRQIFTIRLYIHNLQKVLPVDSDENVDVIRRRLDFAHHPYYSELFP